MKKIFCFILAIIFSLSILNFSACESGCGGNNNFNSTFRFVVTSDVHIRENGDMQSLERLNQLFDTAYAYSDANEYYNKIDAFFFVGDNTQNGLEEEQKLFFSTLSSRTREGTISRAVMGNHEYYATGRYSPSSMENAPLKFMEYSGYDSVDRHEIIGGYHFILLSMDAYGSYSPDGKRGRFYSDEKIDWLKTQLDLALEDDPSGKKPIFVMGHIAPESTVYVSSDKDKKLRDLLNDYPNVVNFSGHSHVNVNDPRSLWQGEFTALSTGSLAYIGVPIAGHPDYKTVSQTSNTGDWRRGYEQGTRNAGMYYICEMNNKNVMKVQIYDAINDCVFGSPIYVDSFGNPKGFDHLPVDPETTDVPRFESAMVSVASNNYKNIRLLFPQAECKEYVSTYKIEVWNYSRKYMRKEEYRLSGYHLGVAMPSMMEVYINGLAEDYEYYIDIYAISIYGKVSEPLTVAIKTSLNDETTATTPDLLNLSYLPNGTAKNLVTQKTLSTINSPIISDDNQVASFDGDSAFVFQDIYDWYDVLSMGYSIEAMVKIHEDSISPQAIVSNYNNGGFSLYYQNGNICFLTKTDGEENLISTPLELDTWAHVVAVYSFEKVSLYVNGVLASEMEITGSTNFPSPNSDILVIGANSGKDKSLNQFAKCSLRDVNIYTHSLDEEGVSTIYSNAIISLI